MAFLQKLGFSLSDSLTNLTDYRVRVWLEKDRWCSKIVQVLNSSTVTVLKNVQSLWIFICFQNLWDLFSCMKKKCWEYTSTFTSISWCKFHSYLGIDTFLKMSYCILLEQFWYCKNSFFFYFEFKYPVFVTFFCTFCFALTVL